MKPVTRSLQKRIILFLIVFLLCSFTGGALENVSQAVALQVGPDTPFSETIPSEQENFSSAVHLPFVLAEDSNAHRLFSDRIFSSSSKNEKTKRNIDLLLYPYSRQQGAAIHRFGFLENIISQALVIYVHLIVISYIHQQDGLK